MTEFVDSNLKMVDSPFGEQRKYRIRYRCAECEHEWRSKWLKAVPKKDPPCPNPSCLQVRQFRQMQLENQRLRAMLEEQRAPAQIGDKPMVKAVDMTASMVMESYGMTDLKDNIREGEAMAPKLPGKAQAAADNYFNPGAGDARAVDFKTNKMRTIQAKHLNAIGQRAIAGSYRKRAVSPIEVIPEPMRKQPPLQLIRTSANPAYSPKS